MTFEELPLEVQKDIKRRLSDYIQLINWIPAKIYIPIIPQDMFRTPLPVTQAVYETRLTIGKDVRFVLSHLE